MDFQRGLDPKQSLGIGLGPKIKAWMSRTADEFNYDDYVEVWHWALEKKKNIVFPYIVRMKGAKWVNGETIDPSDYNNELLWRSIEYKNIAAVKALLAVPGLFRKEILTIEPGTSILEGEFVERGDTKSPMRATNFGAFLNLASVVYENKEIENLLLNYFNDEFSKRA